MRTCKRCKKTQPLRRFSIANKYTHIDGTVSEYRRHICLDCKEIQRKLRLTNNPESKRKHIETSYKAGWKRLGIDLTWGQALQQLKAQNYACAICKIDLENERWHYDHDHITLALRKILCHNCNVGIGHFDEDINLLKLAIKYLESFKE